MGIKSIVFVLALCLIQGTKASDVFETCHNQEGVTKEQIIDLLKDVTLAETNPNLKCFTACVLNNMKILDDCTLLDADMSEDPRINNETILSIETCKNSIQSSEHCQCGYELFKCMTEFYDSMQ